MIEPKQREAKTLLGSSHAKAIRLIRTGTALLLFAASVTVVHGQALETAKTADKKTQLSPQEQSVQRDQAYVRQLLERGTSDAKVESVLKLSSQFTSFHPIGEVSKRLLPLLFPTVLLRRPARLLLPRRIPSESAA